MSTQHLRTVTMNHERRLDAIERGMRDIKQTVDNIEAAIQAIVCRLDALRRTGGDRC